MQWERAIQDETVNNYASEADQGLVVHGGSKHLRNMWILDGRGTEPLRVKATRSDTNEATSIACVLEDAVPDAVKLPRGC